MRTAFCILGWVLASLLPISALAGGDFVVIASPDIELPALAPREVKRLLSGQQTTWPDGGRVTVVLPPRTASALDMVCEELLRVPEDYYRRYLMEKAFSGSIPTPIQAESVEAIVDEVGSVPGAISVIEREELTEGVQVIAIR